MSALQMACVLGHNHQSCFDINEKLELWIFTELLIAQLQYKELIHGTISKYLNICFISIWRIWELQVTNLKEHFLSVVTLMRSSSKYWTPRKFKMIISVNPFVKREVWHKLFWRQSFLVHIEKFNISEEFAFNFFLLFFFFSVELNT
jgi:hypothetical protein